MCPREAKREVLVYHTVGDQRRISRASDFAQVAHYPHPCASYPVGLVPTVSGLKSQPVSYVPGNANPVLPFLELLLVMMSALCEAAKSMSRRGKDVTCVIPAALMTRCHGPFVGQQPEARRPGGAHSLFSRHWRRVTNKKCLCPTNCELVTWEDAEGHLDHELCVHALREIQPGEELTIDYGWPGEAAIRCLCGHESCRGWVVSECELEYWQPVWSILLEGVFSRSMLGRPVVRRGSVNLLVEHGGSRPETPP